MQIVVRTRATGITYRPSQEMKTKLEESQKELDEAREQLQALREQTDESVHKVAEDRFVQLSL